MVGGCSSFIGRRGLFEKCNYWVRDENVKDLSVYKHEKKPKGRFYANQITAMSQDKGQLNNAFSYDVNVITLYTRNYVKLTKGDIVEFKGELWFVVNTQYTEITKNQQFMTRPNIETYIQIKR